MGQWAHGAMGPWAMVRAHGPGPRACRGAMDPDYAAGPGPGPMGYIYIYIYYQYIPNIFPI